MSAAAPSPDTSTDHADKSKPTAHRRGAERLDPVECAFNLLKSETPIYFTPHGIGYAEVRLVDGTVAQYRIESATLRRWLSFRTYTIHRIALSGQEAEAAITLAAGKAQAEGKQHPVYVRLALDPDPSNPGVLYLDPGSRRDGKVLRIDAGGWQYAPPPAEVKFWRPEGFQPLPDLDPCRDGGATLADLRRFLNLGPKGEEETEDRFRLIVGWLMGCLMPRGAYPLLAINGPKGSAKSTAMRYLRCLLDPHEAIMNEPPEKMEELLLQADQTWVTTFDNLRSIKPSLSDALCRLSTGMAAGRRKLWSDDTRMLYSVHRPAIINGIPDLARADDLLQRTLRVRLRVIAEDARELDTVLDAAYEAARPRLLAALLDAACVALAEREAVAATERRRPRLADWYIWVLAAARSGKLGFTPDDFKATVQRNQEQGRQAALEHNPVTDALLDWIGQQPGRTWTGSTAALQVALTDWATTHGVNVHSRYVNWPEKPQAMTSRLAAAEDDLAEAGLTLTRLSRDFAHGRRLKLTYCPLQTQPQPQEATMTCMSRHDEAPVVARHGPVPDKQGGHDDDDVHVEGLESSFPGEREDREKKERGHDVGGTTCTSCSTPAADNAGPEAMSRVKTLPSTWHDMHVMLQTEAQGETAWARAFSLVPTCPNPYHPHVARYPHVCPISKLPLPQPEKWAQAAERPFEAFYDAEGMVVDIKPPLAGCTGLLAAAGAYLLLDQHLDLPADHKLRRVYEQTVARFEAEAKKLACPHPGSARKTIARPGSPRVTVRCQECGADLTDPDRPL